MNLIKTVVDILRLGRKFSIRNVLDIITYHKIEGKYVTLCPKRYRRNIRAMGLVTKNLEAGKEPLIVINNFYGFDALNQSLTHEHIHYILNREGEICASIGLDNIDKLFGSKIWDSDTTSKWDWGLGRSPKL